jgi:hypothetical protein
MSVSGIQTSQNVNNPYLQLLAKSTPETSSSTTTTQDKVTLSSEGKEAARVAEEESKSNQVFQMDTARGERSININDYFTNRRNPNPVDLASISNLLTPTQKNIEALTQHSSAEFKQLLADYNIPEAPAKISYDSSGHIQFPDDYQYSTELTQALDENPGLADELHTLAALTSHYVGMRNPGSKYEISINFSDDYLMQMMFDDKPYLEA